MIERKTIWSEAGMPGLVLGLVSLVFFVVTSLFQSPLLNVVLWLVKLVGCIYLMYFFIKKFASLHDGVSNSDTFRFGSTVALLSAFIFSVGYFVFVQYIRPDTFKDAMDAAMQAYSSFLDSNSIEMMENMLPKLPTIGFFVNLFWCWLYGTIVSAIISRSVPSHNPFDENK